MGQIVSLNDYAAKRETLQDAIDLSTSLGSDEQDPVANNGLVPIELAAGFVSREKCLSKIEEYGLRAIHVRMVNDEPTALLYLMNIKDAISLNLQILESEELPEDEIMRRIDIIQMLENADVSLIDTLWDSFTSTYNSRSGR